MEDGRRCLKNKTDKKPYVYRYTIFGSRAAFTFEFEWLTV